jgi:hypothetical protein
MFEAIAIIAVATIKAIITATAGVVAIKMHRNHNRAKGYGRRGH